MKPMAKADPDHEPNYGETESPYRTHTERSNHNIVRRGLAERLVDEKKEAAKFRNKALKAGFGVAEAAGPYKTTVAIRHKVVGDRLMLLVGRYPDPKLRFTKDQLDELIDGLIAARQALK